MIELYQTFNVRFGVMTVGPTGGGKTTCCQLLQTAQSNLKVRDRVRAEPDPNPNRVRAEPDPNPNPNANRRPNRNRNPNPNQASGTCEDAEMAQTVHTYVFNPKCISMGELYGELLPLTLTTYP